MKILITSDLGYPYIGGGESYVINLSKALIDLGHEVHWATSRIEQTPKTEDYEGIRIHRMRILFPKSYLFPGRHTFPLTSFIPLVKLSKNMDILQFTTFLAGTIGAKVGKFAKKPSILFCHEFFGKLWKTIGQSKFERNLFPHIEKYIAKQKYTWALTPSEYSKMTLAMAGYPENEITVIPHGIDKIFTEDVSGLPLRKKYSLEKYKLFGYTGRLSIKGTGQSKNLLGLLEATKLVVKEIPDARLVLGGSGFDDIKKHISSMGLNKYVVYVGKRPFNEVPQFYSMCNTIVCPALSDGYCFVLGEASACGIPIVATDQGSHPERIIDGKNGFITQKAPQSIAEGVIKILKSKRLEKSLGEQGKKMYRKESWEKVAKKYIEIYETVINKYKYK